MRRHAKAPSAGSTEGNGDSRGLLRRAFAIRGGSDGSSGSGASSSRRSRLLLATAAALTLALILGVAFASAVAPTVSVKDASAVKASTAHVEGEVDPQGQSTTYRFQYATQVDFSDAATAKEETIEGSNQGVEADLTGLTPNTTYHLRLVAENADGPSEAVATSTFTTEAVTPPTVVSIADASDVGFTKAKVSGVVERPADADPAANVECRFEYVSELDFRARNEEQLIYVRAKGGLFTLIFSGERTYEVPFNATAAQVREALEALNAIGVGDIIVTGGPGNATASTPYQIEFDGSLGGQDVALLGSDSSELDGQDPIAFVQPVLDGHPEEGFNRAATAFCDGSPLESAGTQAVETQLNGLTPSTTYHLRLTAKNGGGANTVTGNTFSTQVGQSPTISLGPVINITTTSADATSTVNPNGTPTTAYYEFSSDGVNWTPAPFCNCLSFNPEPYPVELGEGASPVPLDRTIREPVNGGPGTGPPLEPNTTYLLRLRAQNSAGVTVSPNESFRTAPVPPIAQTLGVGSASTTSATLSGRINPRNTQTAYQFEWGVAEGENDSSYENVAPASPQPLGAADSTFHGANAPIDGLAPDTTYHYRIVAIDTEHGVEAKGSDRRFTTISSPAGPTRCPNESSRVGPSANLPDCRAFELVTPDINNIYGDPSNGMPSLDDGSAIRYFTYDAPNDAEGAFAYNWTVSRRGPDGWKAKSAGPPATAPVEGWFPAISDGLFSEDFREAMIWSAEPLAGNRPRGDVNLYQRKADGTYVAISTVGRSMGADYQWLLYGVELTRASTDFKRIIFRTGGPQLPIDPVPFGDQSNVYEWFDGEVKMVSLLPSALPGGDDEPAPQGARIGEGALPALSADATEVLFQANGYPGLYLRSDGTETTEISASQRTPVDTEAPASADSVGITADGSEVLFTSAGRLTDDANKGVDLYSYDVQSGDLTDLTAVTDLDAEANVQAVVAASRDGSYVYFVASGDLAPGALSVSGSSNLYVEHEGQITFISPIEEPGSADPLRGSYMTPNGLHLMFASARQLTSYDNVGKPEIYHYAYADGLECVSCRPSGEPPSGGARLASGRVRSMTEDGSRIFFNSADAIIPGASNGKVNPYEYSEGEVHLLAPGDSANGALFVSISASGDDAFLAAHEALVPGMGTRFSIYDARVNAETLRPTPPECVGEGCLDSATSAPRSQGAGSAAFEAPGEVAAPRSKAAKARKLNLRITVPESGQLTVSGKGIKTVSKSVAKAGPVTLTLTLEPRANKRRLKKGVFKTRAQVLFKPKAGSVSRSAGASPVVALTFEGPTEKGGK